MVLEIYPKEFPYDLIKEPKRRAESKVYAALKSELTEEFIIYYNVPWTASLTDDDSELKDGEADFIILWRDHGFFSIEVKGGSVGFDENTMSYYSIGMGGKKYSIKHPFEQAKRSKHVLLNQLKSHPGFLNQKIGMAHLVFFPDLDRIPNINQISTNKDLILTGQSFGRIVEELKRIFHLFNKDDYNFSFENFSVLKRILSSSFCLKPLLSTLMKDTDEGLMELTKSQFKVLRSFQKNKRMLITGSAGTGKTLLAIECARKFAGDEVQTIYVCYNKLLAESIKLQIGKTKNLSIFTFHELCYYVEKISNQGNPPFLNNEIHDQNYFNNVLPDRFMEALSNTSMRFGCIIVDEAQDFLENWWVPLEESLSGKNANFYIFYDENQNINTSKLKLPFESPILSLNENKRNTNQIFNIAMRFFEGNEKPDPSNIDGLEVSILNPGIQNVVAEISSLVRRLVQHEKVSKKDIAILTCVEKGNSILKNATNLGVFRLTDDIHNEEGIFFDTVKRFKGMERSAIILIDINLISEENKNRILFIGTTRAKSGLFVVADTLTKRLFEG